MLVGLLFGGGLALRGAPADIFPNLGVPVIYVVQPYGGMSPTQMEGQLVGYYEYLTGLKLRELEQAERAST